MGVRATFLEVEADTSLLRIESGIFQQVEQDTFQLFFIRFYLEFGAFTEGVTSGFINSLAFSMTLSQKVPALTSPIS